MNLPKEYSELPVAGLKEMDFQELLNKKFQLLVLTILRELQVTQINTLTTAEKQCDRKHKIRTK